MSWNCRIIRYLDGSINLCEVNYNKNGEPFAYSDITFKYTAEEGSSSLITDLEDALKDVKNTPILDVKELLRYDAPSNWKITKYF